MKAVVFDIDGTLTDNVSWFKITELLGASVEEHAKIFDDLLKDKLSLPEAREQIMSLWQATGNANKDFLRKIFRDWTYRDDAGPLIEYCKEQGYEVALITGSLDLFAEYVALHFGIKHWYSNSELVCNDSGELVDFYYEQDQASKKLEQFEEFIKLVRVDAEDCFVVGDSANDVKLFERTEKGIAVHTDDQSLQRAAWRKARSLSEVKEFIN